MTSRMSWGTELSKPLRADAARNRERIVAAATRLFVEQGPQVTLEEIAQSAGVALATFYRRFPSRTDLEVAVFERSMTSYVDAVDKALANPYAWEGFRDLVYDLCELHTSGLGARALLSSGRPPSITIEQHASEILDKIEQVIARAQQQGTLRPDIGVGDIVMMSLAHNGVLDATRKHTPDAWYRFAALMIDSFRVGPTEPLKPPPESGRSRKSLRTYADWYLNCGGDSSRYADP